MIDYRINIFYSVEDGEYIAHIPGLRFCSASGATPEEALHEVLIAKALWLETAQEEGKRSRRRAVVPPLIRSAHSELREAARQ